MKIAVISDSHKKPDLTQQALQMLKQKGAQYIVHAGDLEIEENLQIVKDLKLPYVCVFGNNDYSLLPLQHNYNIYKEPYYFKIKDISFKLMHLPFYLTPDSDIIIFGHTHSFESYIQDKKLFLNPGEVCARNKNLSEAVLLDIQHKKYIVEYYFKAPKENSWQVKEYIYNRDS